MHNNPPIGSRRLLKGHVHRSTIHNCQKVKATQMFISRWTNKLNVVHPHNGVLFSPEKKWSTDRCYNRGEFWKHATWKKPGTARCTLCDPADVEYPGKEKPWRQNAGTEEGGGERLLMETGVSFSSDEGEYFKVTHSHLIHKFQVSSMNLSLILLEEELFIRLL